MKKIITTVFAICASASLFGQSYPTNGLVGFWGFESSFLSNSNITLTRSNSDVGVFVSDRKDKSESAFNVNGALKLSLDPEVYPATKPNNISISVWIMPNIANCGYYPILAKQGNLDNTFNSFTLGLVNNKDNPLKSEVYGQIGIDGVIYKVSKLTDLALINNVWTHLVLTYDGSDIKLFMNNNLLDSKTKIGTIDFSKANTSQVYASDYNGLFDDLAIYNKALNTTEITHLFTGTAGNTSVTKINTESGFTIYPNPAKNILQISSDKEIKTAVLINNWGQITEVDIINNRIEIGNFLSGVYVIQIKDKKGNLYTNKFIKE